MEESREPDLEETLDQIEQGLRQLSLHVTRARDIARLQDQASPTTQNATTQVTRTVGTTDSNPGPEIGDRVRCRGNTTGRVEGTIVDIAPRHLRICIDGSTGTILRAAHNVTILRNVRPDTITSC